MSSSAPSIICLGRDVHKDSITIAILLAAARSSTRLERLPNDSAKLERFLDRVARDGELTPIRMATRPLSHLDTQPSHINARVTRVRVK
jgi:hypothetical protein